MARASCWTSWRGKGCAATRARRHVSVGIPQVWFSTVVCTTTKGSQLSPLPHTHTTTTTTRIPPHPHRPAAAVQLVVTCEVCRRPATKECWTCGMQICEFCTLKRHWKVPESPTHAASSCLVTLPPPHTWTQFITCDLLLPPRCLQGTFPLHWPLVNSDHMRERLAKRELERKRVEDADRLQLEDPNFRRGEGERARGEGGLRSADSYGAACIANRVAHHCSPPPMLPLPPLSLPLPALQERGRAARHPRLSRGGGRGGADAARRRPRRRRTPVPVRPAPRPLLPVGTDRSDRVPGLPRAHGCGGGEQRSAVQCRAVLCGWREEGAWQISPCASIPHHAAGYEDRELVVECSQRGLLLQSEASPPIIDRLFDHGVDASRPVETFRRVEGLSSHCPMPARLGNGC